MYSITLCILYIHACMYNSLVEKKEQKVQKSLKHPKKKGKKKGSLIKKLLRVISQKKFIININFRGYIKKTVWEENNIRLMGKEFLAEEYQSYFPVWNGIGHYYKPHFFIKGTTFFKKGLLVSKSRKLKENASEAEIDEIMKKLYGKIPAEAPKVLWSETMDKHFLKELLERLTEKQKLFIENKLSNTFLPVTGAHGDLKDEHFFKNSDNSFYIIDWEFFRPEGSIVTDILRLYSMRQMKHLKKRGIKISQYNPMLVLNHGLESCIDLSLVGGKIEIALLTMITNCCIPSTGCRKKRLQRFTRNISNIMENYEEILE